MATPPAISEGATGPAVRWAQYLLVRKTLSEVADVGPAPVWAAMQIRRSARIRSLGVGSCCLRGRCALGPGDYSLVLNQLAVHLRVDRAGGELDDVGCCLAG